MTGIRGVRYISVNEVSGYGQAARGYLRALRLAGIPVTWTPMIPGRGLGLYLEPCAGRAVGDAEFDPICNIPLAYDRVIVHLPPPYLPYWRAQEAARALIALTAWETDKLPPGWADMLNQADRIIVPSRWNREVMQAEGVTPPIETAPHLFFPGEAAPLEVPIPQGAFVFHTEGAWSDRKGIYQTLACYWDTFTPADGTLLFIKTSRNDERRTRYGRRWRLVSRWLGGTRLTVRRMRRGWRNPAPIRLHTRTLAEAQIHALHRRSDCFVSLTRGEGWGLGAYEAAFHGKPVIMTGYGGQRDFLQPEWTSFVDYTLTPAEPAGAFERALHHPPQRWAQPDPAHARRLMRAVYENPAAARAQAARQQDWLRTHFAAGTLTRRFLAALQGEPA
jgi:glycosyltransferase involved in cell wall biosynthesis